IMINRKLRFLLSLFFVLFCLQSLTWAADSLKTFPIDTNKKSVVQDTAVKTVTEFDSTNIVANQNKNLSNTQLFLYIILSAAGAGLFFYIFVINLFRTFHKKRSTRQSLMLSWNIFFIVTVIWIFIIWGILASLWSSSSFMIVIIFLFIVGLITTLIALKSK
ncbi:MAG TPA: hypothetical protein PK447_07400, partial [Ignavibacteria bacterium]|nr:hypothetical protein [Ignavibacteria bacterium]